MNELGYFAVIFTNTKRDNNQEYDATAKKLVELAMQQEGFITMEHVESGLEAITISYWQDEAAIQAWKKQADHLVAQQKGRQAWYERYRVRVAKVVRDYDFERI